MKINRFLVFASVGALALFTSCIDNGYDLDNLDKTIQIGANELVIPINLDKITLDKVLNIDEDSKLKKVYDPIEGDTIYAVIEEGEFNSKEIDIPSFSVNSPNIKDIVTKVTNINKTVNDLVDKAIDEACKQYGVTKDDPIVQAMIPSIKQQVWDELPNDRVLADYPIGEQTIKFECTPASVDKALRSIDVVNVDCTMKIKVMLEDLDMIDNLTLNNVVIQLPKGLRATSSKGRYDSKTGKLTFTEGIQVVNGEYSLELEVSAIDFAETDRNCINFQPKEGENGVFTFSDAVKIIDGANVRIRKADFAAGKTFYDLPDEASFTCKTTMSSIGIESFTGKVKYDVDGINVNPISLDGLPDFLAGDETNILLKNPQIYLDVNNPLQQQGLVAQAGLALTPSKDYVERNTLTLDNGQVLRLTKADNSFCLSPSQPAKKYEGHESSEWMAFSTLSQIVGGKGLPDNIEVEVQNPGVPEQAVTDFALGVKYGSVNGSYLFYAPLDLQKYDGTIKNLIVYKTTEDGWNKDGTWDKITLSKVHLTADANTDLPIGATLSLKAIGKDGKELPGVKFEDVELEANAKSQPITFDCTGTVVGLDGIIVTAKIYSDGTAPLKAKQNIELKNVRVTATGAYQDKL